MSAPDLHHIDLKQWVTGKNNDGVVEYTYGAEGSDKYILYLNLKTGGYTAFHGYGNQVASGTIPGFATQTDPPPPPAAAVPGGYTYGSWNVSDNKKSATRTVWFHKEIVGTETAVTNDKGGWSFSHLVGAIGPNNELPSQSSYTAPAPPVTTPPGGSTGGTTTGGSTGGNSGGNSTSTTDTSHVKVPDWAKGMPGWKPGDTPYEIVSDNAPTRVIGYYTPNGKAVYKEDNGNWVEQEANSTKTYIVKSADGVASTTMITDNSHLGNIGGGGNATAAPKGIDSRNASAGFSGNGQDVVATPAWSTSNAPDLGGMGGSQLTANGTRTALAVRESKDGSSIIAQMSDGSYQSVSLKDGAVSGAGTWADGMNGFNKTQPVTTTATNDSYDVGGSIVRPGTALADGYQAPKTPTSTTTVQPAPAAGATPQELVDGFGVSAPPSPTPTATSPPDAVDRFLSNHTSSVPTGPPAVPAVPTQTTTPGPYIGTLPAATAYIDPVGNRPTVSAASTLTNFGVSNNAGAGDNVGNIHHPGRFIAE